MLDPICRKLVTRSVQFWRLDREALMHTNEEIDARMARWVEAWRAAHARCAAITDDKARSQAAKVADEIFQRGIHDCLRPLFKAARKQKDPKVKKEKKPK